MQLQWKVVRLLLVRADAASLDGGQQTTVHQSMVKAGRCSVAACFENERAGVSPGVLPVQRTMAVSSLRCSSLQPWLFTVLSLFCSCAEASPLRFCDPGLSWGVLMGSASAEDHGRARALGS